MLPRDFIAWETNKYFSNATRYNCEAAEESFKNIR